MRGPATAPASRDAHEKGQTPSQVCVQSWGGGSCAAPNQNHNVSMNGKNANMSQLGKTVVYFVLSVLIHSLD